MLSYDAYIREGERDSEEFHKRKLGEPTDKDMLVAAQQTYRIGMAEGDENFVKTALVMLHASRLKVSDDADSVLKAFKTTVGGWEIETKYKDSLFKLGELLIRAGWALCDANRRGGKLYEPEEIDQYFDWEVPVKSA